MKLWKDSDELTPVRWFFTKPGAKVFEPISSFRSLKTWDRESDRTGMVGEKLGVTPYDKGSNPIGYEGLRHCGSDLAMQEGGVSGRDPVILTTSMGDSPCCKTPPTAGICMTGLDAPFKWRIPLKILLTILGPSSCPRFNGAQFLLLRLGSGEITDLSTPGDGPVFAGTSCVWTYLSAKTVVSESPAHEDWIVFGVAFGAAGEDRPEGCPGDNCIAPRVYWKVVHLNKLTGVETVEIRTEHNYDGYITAQGEPLVISISDSISPPLVFGCSIGGADPLTRTLLVITAAS